MLKVKINFFNFLETFLGTTKKGIGPTYASRANRYGLRIGDLKNWELFEKNFMYMHAIFKEKEK
jgi:adenylosuccinate synthase